ncbi:MAG: DUF805 domain-containing protein [Paracoccus denitrificans]|uniref:DUF805 domain-containing protein n=1 Tax=Paracoccus denitrificans TaxID=266 RepID=A0A533ID14_PARDE|nr:MAG: DUF805 domain-containing protein [Paracoccus denitrificans]
MTDLSAPDTSKDPAISAVRECLTKYATFSGRAPRSEFWYFVLFLIAAQIAFIVLNGIILGPTVTVMPNGVESRYYGNGWLGQLFMLATIIPLLAVGWRRLHDRNLSGWWFLVPSALQIALTVGLFVYLFGASALWLMLRSYGTVSFGFSGSNIALLVVIVFVAHILLLVTLVRRGTRGPNRFGPDPLGGAA